MATSRVAKPHILLAPNMFTGAFLLSIQIAPVYWPDELIQV